MSESENEPATQYVVLRAATEQTGDDPRAGWIEVLSGAITARTANEAVKRAAASRAVATGTYVAVPSRSWKPVTVKAETRIVLTLDQATT